MCTLGGNADDTLNPVRKALRRAEARPKNLAKSMEDITASSLPSEHVFHISTSNVHNARINPGSFCHWFLTGQERRQDPTADIRNISDGRNFLIFFVLVVFSSLVDH